MADATIGLIGRDDEIGAVIRLLDGDSAPRSGVVVITGEGGIGKSRLAAAAAQAASDRGRAALMGRADDLDRGVPFAVFRDLLSRLDLQRLTGERLEAVLTLDRAIRADFAVAGTPANHMNTVFHLLRDLLVSVGRDRTSILMTLEDIHRADPESVRLLSLIARHTVGLPLLVVVTCRDFPATSSTELMSLFEQLESEDRASIIRLRPLERYAVGELIQQSLSLDPEGHLVDAVLERSGGNPFFIQEVLAEAVRSGLIGESSGSARLVGPLSAAPTSSSIVRRYVDADGPELEVARVISALGRFSFVHLGLVERITGRTPDGVAKSFDRLLESGLITRAAHGGYEFVHPIVRDSVYEDIGPAERRHMHGVIAQSLRLDERAGVIGRPLELATHVAESAQPPDVDAAAILLQAARIAEPTAPLVAAGWYETAARLLPTGQIRVSALAMQTRQLLIGGRPRDAVAVGRTVMDEGDDDLARRVSGVVISATYIAGVLDEALEAVDQALSAGAHEVPLLAQRTNFLGQLGRADEAEAQVDGALAASGASSAAEAVALSYLLHYTRLSRRRDVRAEVLKRMNALDPRCSLPSRAMMHDSRALECGTGETPGFLTEGEHHLQAAKALRAGFSETSYAGVVEGAAVHVLFYRGHWDDAIETARRATFDLGLRKANISLAMLASYDALISVARGDRKRAELLLPQLRARTRACQGLVALARAAVHRSLGNITEASATIEAHLATTTPDALVERALLVEELADIALEAGDLACARSLAGQIDGGDRFSLTHIVMLRARGHCFGDIDAAQQCVADADEVGMPFEVARARLVLGTLDIQPRHNLRLAHEGFSSLGAIHWRQRTAKAMRVAGVGLPPQRSNDASTVLRGVDAELARLVGSGLTNPEIAAALHYSRKTVEVYLSRIYKRTGYHGRWNLVKAIELGEVTMTTEL